MQNICNSLFVWISEGNLDMIKSLDKINLLRCTKRGRNLLHEASFQGEIEIVIFLLDSGFDPNERDGEGNTPIHLAFCNNNLEIVKILIERGADPNVPDKDGFTILHKAEYLGLSSLKEFLIRHGARTDLKDSLGRRAYEYRRDPGLNN
ncbi:ankyrin repeat domain-containing protein [Metallosphaera hakonensis]|uniref:Ankyrin repeat domain-containing protein n=1 Tax=Metallosphaera hakonensis JCM 8857 = DSM 7519 TaxID=1293036 RepID=A0A2U9IT85_9CREN|nr:ankyrin repeat domain-containing protein [Metallosphaera hakonensis]AWR99173.1 ankyrin repeat domain-containing protein [Metallosphaera hakonensis JCM 8857 = DSM 7519]